MCVLSFDVMKGYGMSWTKERIEQLRQMWDEGKSTGEIGKALGVSKNAVVGKAHRLGLNPRPSPIKRNSDAMGSDSSQSGSVSLLKTGSKKKGLSLLELTSHSCRWPIGDPKDADFHFCGKEVMLGKNYCEEHMAEAFVGVSKK